MIALAAYNRPTSRAKRTDGLETMIIAAPMLGRIAGTAAVRILNASTCLSFPQLRRLPWFEDFRRRSLLLRAPRSELSVTGPL